MHVSKLGFVFVVALICCLGCSNKATELIPAKGVLKIDGKPAGNILVQFMPDASKGLEGPTSTGITDANGNFELATLDNRPGAVPGPHVVILVDQAGDRPAQGEEIQRPPRLHSSYATEKGGLRVMVEPERTIALNVDSSTDSANTVEDSSGTTYEGLERQ